MLRDFQTLKDVLLASAILLVIVASRAEGQVRAALLTRSVPPDAEGAIMALEESREALLEARDAIDAALRKVDETLASLGETRPRERGFASAPGPASSRVPSVDDLRFLWVSVTGLYSGIEAQLAPWGARLAGASSKPAPATAGAAEPGPIAPALEPAAFAGGDPAAAEPQPASGPNVDLAPSSVVLEQLPDRILDAAGAFLRALDDAAARVALPAPEPESRDPSAEQTDAVPAETTRRADTRTDR